MHRNNQVAPLLLIGLFLASRAVTYFLWLRPDVAFVANDVSYYGYHLDRLESGATDVMREYPPPAVWILHALYRLGGGWQTWFGLYAGFFLALDGVVAATLYRRTNWRASLFWILFTGANGAIVWFRFDLLPAALVAWACLWMSTRPRVAGVMVGLGASIKLWPALLIAPLLAPDPRSDPARGRLLGFLASGLGLAGASLAVEGWERNTDPLTWQGDRGLQIESIPATPLMWLRTYTENPSWNIKLSEFNALEVYGPGVDLLLGVSSVLTVASVVVTALLAVLLIRRRAGAPSILLAILTILLATIVANKTLSPQYILWLGGPVAVLFLHEGSTWSKRHLRVIALSLVCVGGLTQFTYPWGAYGIMAIPMGSGPETSVLILRNLILLVLLGYAGYLTVASTRRPPAPATPVEPGTHDVPELAKL
jgi:hypothetical protein